MKYIKSFWRFINGRCYFCNVKFSLSRYQDETIVDYCNRCQIYTDTNAHLYFWNDNYIAVIDNKLNVEDPESKLQIKLSADKFLPQIFYQKIQLLEFYE